MGYNGINFHGSQKNKDVRSVEEEIEKVFYKLGMISDFNYGDLKKIGWGRATRTDKRVHALMNTFSCKVLLETQRKEGKWTWPSTERELDELRMKVNKELPDDIKIFCLHQTANNFNAKNCTTYREYSYYLPTFMLTSISKLYLATPPKTEEEKAEEEKKDPAAETKQEVVTQMS